MTTGKRKWTYHQILFPPPTWIMFPGQIRNSLIGLGVIVSCSTYFNWLWRFNIIPALLVSDWMDKFILSSNHSNEITALVWSWFCLDVNASAEYHHPRPDESYVQNVFAFLYFFWILVIFFLLSGATKVRTSCKNRKWTKWATQSNNHPHKRHVCARIYGTTCIID